MTTYIEYVQYVKVTRLMILRGYMVHALIHTRIHLFRAVDQLRTVVLSKYRVEFSKLDISITHFTVSDIVQGSCEAVSGLKEFQSHP